MSELTQDEIDKLESGFPHSDTLARVCTYARRTLDAEKAANNLRFDLEAAQTEADKHHQRAEQAEAKRERTAECLAHALSERDTARQEAAKLQSALRRIAHGNVLVKDCPKIAHEALHSSDAPASERTLAQKGEDAREDAWLVGRGHIPSWASATEREKSHSDDAAVDRFAAAMKAKLAEKRDEGRDGWDDPDRCSIEYLADLLLEHIPKGDPVGIGNFAMMLHQRGAIRTDLLAAPAPTDRPQTDAQREALEALNRIALRGENAKCGDFQAIRNYILSQSGQAVPRAVMGLRYYVNNPSAWEDGFNQNVSDAIERALATHPADGDSPAVPDGYVLIRQDVVDFLHGTAPLDGEDFNDRQNRERGRYWWRKLLPPYSAAAPDSTGESHD